MSISDPRWLAVSPPLAVDDGERQNHPPDGGEPQGSLDPDRPAMLGRRFQTTIAAGMLIGLVLALAAHWLLTSVWYSANGWSWFIVGLGGLAVGGALSLFLYGAATDRSGRAVCGTNPLRRGRAGRPSGGFGTGAQSEAISGREAGFASYHDCRHTIRHLISV